MSEPLPTSSLERCLELLSQRIEAEGRRGDLIETRVIPLLERIAVALETAPRGGSGSGEDHPSASSRLREAIKSGDWDLAGSILDDLGPDHPLATRLADHLAQARAGALVDLQGQLDAAKQVNDPDGAIGLRDRMVPLLEPGPLRDLDQGLARWLMGLVQRRLRGGTIRPDVAQLAAIVSERFAATSEGASMKAALPTLRRSAGLCPRCGEPYVGDEDTCPQCRAETETRVSPFLEGSSEEDEPEELEVEPLDLNHERNWEGV